MKNSGNMARDSRLLHSRLLPLALSLLLCSCVRTYTNFTGYDRVEDIEAQLPAGDSLVGIDVTVAFAHEPAYVLMMITRKGKATIEVERFDVQVLCDIEPEPRRLAERGVKGSREFSDWYRPSATSLVPTLEQLPKSLRIVDSTIRERSLYLTRFFALPSRNVDAVVVYLRADVVVDGKPVRVRRELRVEKKTTTRFCFSRCC